MPARSLIEEMRGWYATAVRGEVSDANVRGYLRAASQIEDVWQEVDNQLAQLQVQGAPPWEAYHRLRYPLAFVRAGRTYQVFVQQLLEADAAFDHITLGYLPPVTFDQANALCHQILPNLQQAIAALHNPRYEPEAPFPLELGPRIEVKGHTCPLPHLAGMLGAAREADNWTAGMVAEYATAVAAAQTPVPSEITGHVGELQGRLAQAESQLRFAEDLVGQITEGEATPSCTSRRRIPSGTRSARSFCSIRPSRCRSCSRLHPPWSSPRLSITPATAIAASVPATSGASPRPAPAASCCTRHLASPAWRSCAPRWATSCPRPPSSISTR